MAVKKEESAEQGQQTKSKMRFYAVVQDTPAEAKKTIGAGRLKGMTDVNPMYRIKRLTEVFGPAGFGWWTQDEEFTFQESKNGEVAVFCKLHLVVVDPDTREESKPIFGVGGNKFLKNETKGQYCDDEALKMAYTDALSIACKSLGFCHDIYFSKDRTKYSSDEDSGPTDEDYQDITARIQKGISVITKDMDKDAKDKFTQDVIVKHIGNQNYMLCKDMGKLSSLLEELRSIAKKN